MVRRIKQWLDDQMRDAPRPWNVIVPILAVGGSIFCIGSLIGYFVWYNLPSTVTYREHGLQLLRLEIAALPPYPGSHESNRIESAERGPSIEVDYYPADDCMAVQEYYKDLLVSKGWAVQRFHGPSSDTRLESTYSKTVEEYPLNLALSCATNPKSDNDRFIILEISNTGSPPFDLQHRDERGYSA